MTPFLKNHGKRLHHHHHHHSEILSPPKAFGGLIITRSFPVSEQEGNSEHSREIHSAIFFYQTKYSDAVVICEIVVINLMCGKNCKFTAGNKFYVMQRYF